MNFIVIEGVYVSQTQMKTEMKMIVKNCFGSQLIGSRGKRIVE